MPQLDSPHDYVCAFNRDRDHYEVAAALAEVGALRRLYTDYYYGPGAMRRRLGNGLGLRHRSHDLVDPSLVSGDLVCLLLQGLTRRSRTLSRSAFKVVEQRLGNHVRDEVNRQPTNVVAYSGCALAGFNASVKRGDGSERVLFVFHPPSQPMLALLEDDRGRFPEIASSFGEHRREILEVDSDRLGQEVALATQVICASTFTANCIEAAFSEPTDASVVPYGFSDPAQRASSEPPQRGRPQLLFVGQGVQRKGLHHLLHAWRDSQLGKVADLKLVLSKVDPGLSSHLSQAGVAVVSGISRSALEWEYCNADIFVMPSLIEGFGLVYLEALAAGCFVIGTENTGLPDLKLPSWGSSMAEVASPSSIAAEMLSAVSRIQEIRAMRYETAELASVRPWGAFRSELREALRLKTS